MQNFLGLEEKYSNQENSKIVVLPIPFERTTSYIKGTKNAPLEIIKASHQVEFYDEELDCEAYKNGIYTDDSFFNSEFEKLETKQVFQKISKKISEYIKEDKFVISLGGEHSISAPIIKPYFEKLSDLVVIQFDAHSDLRDSYEGSKDNHACVMKRIYELTSNYKNIFQIGIRAQCFSERKFIIENDLNIVYMHEINKDPDRLSKLASKIKNKKVYITLDLDAFDPTLIPTLGTPEPNGLMWQDFFNFFKQVNTNNEIIGMDVVELCPNPHFPYSNFTVARMIYRMISQIC